MGFGFHKTHGLVSRTTNPDLCDKKEALVIKFELKTVLADLIVVLIPERVRSR